MKMLTVQGSDAIEAIGYDSKRLRMVIQFKREEGEKKSRKYTFCGVPEHIFNGFLYAQSRGEYYDRWIRGKYLCLR